MMRPPCRKPDGHDEVIHVVDDDEGLRKSLGFMLSTHGFQVRTYCSGEAFLKEFRPEMDGCVILDIQMPPGVSGLEVYDRLVEMRAPIPVIFLTAHATVPMAVAVTRKGALDVLEKGGGSVGYIEKFAYSEELVLRRLREALAVGRQRRAERQFEEQIAGRLLNLTPREREVLDCVLRGMPNSKIEGELAVGSGVVELHRKHCMEKMEATRPQQIAEWIAAMKKARQVDSVMELWERLVIERLQTLSNRELGALDFLFPPENKDAHPQDEMDNASLRRHRARILDKMRPENTGQLGRWIRQIKDAYAVRSVAELMGELGRPLEERDADARA